MAPLNDLKRSLHSYAPAEKRCRVDEVNGTSKHDFSNSSSKLPDVHSMKYTERKSSLSKQAAKKQLDALHGMGRAANTSQLSVEELLRTPLTFVPATNLTAEAERRLSKVESSLQSRGSKQEQGNQLSTNEASKIFEAQTQWPQSGRPSQGLPNPGNLCYRRSVLQALLHLPAFVHWICSNHSHIKSAEPQKSGGKRQSLAAGKSSSSICLACALRSLSYEYWHSSSKGVIRQELRNFDRAVSALGPRSIPKWSASGSLTQADAHEFLYWMLQVLENERNKPTHEVSQLFKLTHRGIWTCPSCGFDHTSQPGKETGLVLGLTHPQRGLPLRDYVDAYYQTRIDGLRCDKCNWTGTAIRRTEIVGPGPHVLFVQLRRFERVMRMPGKGLSNGHNGRNGGKARHGGSKANKRGLLATVTAAYAGGGVCSGGSVNRKISGPVPYEHTLDLGKYAARSDRDGDGNENKRYKQPSSSSSSSSSPSSSSLKYRLSSVVAHAGMLNDGHYTLIASRPSVNRSSNGTSGKNSSTNHQNNKNNKSNDKKISNDGSGSGSASGSASSSSNGSVIVVNLDDESVSRAHKRDLLDPPGGFTPYILTYVRDDGRDTEAEAEAEADAKQS